MAGMSSSPRSVSFTAPTCGAPHQPAGQTVCYELLARIGGGSFGRVFLARSFRDGQEGHKQGRIIRVPPPGHDPETASSSSASDTCSVASATPPTSPRAGGEPPLGLTGGAGASSFARASSPEGNLSSGGSDDSGSSSSSACHPAAHPRLRSEQAVARAAADAGDDVSLVAIKLLRRSAISKHTLAEISNQLQQLHPHITTMHQVLLTRHHIAMVLDYANGGLAAKAAPEWVCSLGCCLVFFIRTPRMLREVCHLGSIAGAWICVGAPMSSHAAMLGAGCAEHGTGRAACATSQLRVASVAGCPWLPLAAPGCPWLLLQQPEPIAVPSCHLQVGTSSSTSRLPQPP
jgi:hypothetical protein